MLKLVTKVAIAVMLQALCGHAFVTSLNPAFRPVSLWMSAEESEGQLSAEDEDLSGMQSAALDWSKKQRDMGGDDLLRKRFLVIGGGWGGWGAAKALCESGIDADVTLLDALPDPTGVGDRGHVPPRPSHNDAFTTLPS